ncbi:MAG TPA: cell wall hydrolase [Halanaerobiales bacterium]|nr:cell wall hydrolase [Halanaerobiales bacterium]
MKLLSFAFLIIGLLLILFTGICFSQPEFILIYVVQEGDALYDIASAYGVSVSSIKEANNLENEAFIRLGQELVIPYLESTNQENHADWRLPLYSRSQPRNDLRLEVGEVYSIRINSGREVLNIDIPPDKLIDYHVGMGDTLYDLARSFNTSIGVIMALNEMDSSIIRIGDIIKLPINNLTPRQVLQKTVKSEDLELLARAIYGEARGEPFIGQVAVGAVIINRVLSDYFPDTFYQVIYQSGQFSAVYDGQINLRPNNTAYQAAQEALKGTDPTVGALYFYNPRIAKNQWWFESRRTMVTIGEHVFTK